MTRVFILLTLIISAGALWPQDPSTPLNGNLHIETSTVFQPSRLTIHDSGEWPHPNIELTGNRLIPREESVRIPFVANRTPNTDILWIDDSTFVALTGRTDSYPHGILGDRIESTGFSVYQGNELILDYKLPNGRVFETLRPMIEDIVPENPGLEIILTSSDRDTGARIDVFSLEGELIGSSRPIGRGYRWLHVIGAASFNDSERKYIVQVRTPHIGGVLELLTWTGGALEVEASLGNVSTHKIGSDNLNMALIISDEGSAAAKMYIPSYDFMSLLVIEYTGGLLREKRRFNLPDELMTNVLFDGSRTASLWMGLANGSIAQIHE